MNTHTDSCTHKHTYTHSLTHTDMNTETTHTQPLSSLSHRSQEPGPPHQPPTVKQGAAGAVAAPSFGVGGWGLLSLGTPGRGHHNPCPCAPSKGPLKALPAGPVQLEAGGGGALEMRSEACNRPITVTPARLLPGKNPTISQGHPASCGAHMRPHMCGNTCGHMCRHHNSSTHKSTHGCRVQQSRVC